MNLKNVIIAICSQFFFVIGADKFLAFLEPPCSLESSISPMIWKVLGVLQFVSGILIWLPKYRKQVAGFWAVFMVIFSIVHLTQNTYDIGGAAIMAILLGLFVWNPDFLGGSNK